MSNQDDTDKATEEQEAATLAALAGADQATSPAFDPLAFSKRKRKTVQRYAGEGNFMEADQAVAKAESVPYTQPPTASSARVYDDDDEEEEEEAHDEHPDGDYEDTGMLDQLNDDEDSQNAEFEANRRRYVYNREQRDDHVARASQKLIQANEQELYDFSQSMPTDRKPREGEPATMVRLPKRLVTAVLNGEPIPDDEAPEFVEHPKAKRENVNPFEVEKGLGFVVYPPVMAPSQVEKIREVENRQMKKKIKRERPIAERYTGRAGAGAVDYTNPEGEFSGDEESDEEVKKIKIVNIEFPGDSWDMESILCHRQQEKPSEGQDEAETEYLIKWKKRGYNHVSWKTKSELSALGYTARVTRYERKVQRDGANDWRRPFPVAFTKPDRLLTVAQYDDQLMALVKWKGLQYSDATWEPVSDLGPTRDELLADLKTFNSYERARGFKNRRTRPPPGLFRPMAPDHPYKNDHRLREYQREGVDWLRFCWYNKRNSILADEMGLGKTVQTVAMMESLYRYYQIRGPFLVVAPLSTLPHWQREFEAWTDMNVLVYHGSAASRELMRDYEFHFYMNEETVDRRIFKFEVMITTYEVIMADIDTLGQIPWRYLAVDEAHRLKNASSKSLEAIRALDYEHLLLLTGTPLQNNTGELWTLLNLVDPRRFSSSTAFAEHFGELTSAAEVSKLHDLLKPLLLRRMKEHVEKSIAPKEETIIFVELTRKQKEYYRAILDRNIKFLRKGDKSSNAPSLLNVVMELRKCCNHPFLIKGAEEALLGDDQTQESYFKALTTASGKMVLLDKLLPHLRKDGHKVLIFSQMVRVLNLLEEYCQYRNFPVERLDGSVTGARRQAAIDRYTMAESTDEAFVFLLSTRAGGVGINLTAADTVIIFDSDWNPQNDLQAQARCHRIGQKKAVSVYRLITRGTYELEMFDRASKKLGLDQAVLTKMESDSAKSRGVSGVTPLDRHEINSLLKNGAYGVFNEDNSAADAFTQADISTILQRNTKQITREDDAAENAAMAGFSHATFTVEEQEVLDADGNVISVDDPDYWDKLMPHAKHVADPRILYESRKRSTVKRFEQKKIEGLDDDDDDVMTARDAGEAYVDQDGTDGRQHWRYAERNRFKNEILALGYGRWADIKEKADLERWGTEEIRLFGRTFLRLLCKYAKKPTSGPEFERLAFELDNSGISGPGASRERRRRAQAAAEAEALKPQEVKKEEAEEKETKDSSDMAVDTPSDAAVKQEDAAVKPESDANGEAKAEEEEATTKEEEKPDPGAGLEGMLAVVARIKAKCADPASVTQQQVDALNEAAEAAAAGHQIRVKPLDGQVSDSWADDIYDDEMVLQEERFLGHLEKLAPKYIRRLQMLASLGDQVRHLLHHLEKVDFKDYDQLFPGATLEHEKALLIGAYKHGYGRYDAVRLDPELPFHGHVGAPIKDEGFNPKAKKKASSKGKDTVDSYPHDEKGLPMFPSAKSLAHRVGRLTRAVENERTKRTKKSRKRKSSGSARNITIDDPNKPVSDRVLLARETWTRREINDFYRVLSTYGPPPKAPAGSKLPYDWSEHQIRAKLKNKTLKKISEYYDLFMQQTSDIIKYCDPKELEKQKKGGRDASNASTTSKSSAGDAMSAEKAAEALPLSHLQCKRVVNRIIMFLKLRNDVLPHPEFEDRLLRASADPKLPQWWTSEHDVALLRGVAKHGINAWEKFVKDPQLPFRKIAAPHVKDDAVDEDESDNEISEEDEDGPPTKKRRLARLPTPYCDAINFPKESVLLRRMEELMARVMSEADVDTVDIEALSTVEKVQQTLDGQLIDSVVGDQMLRSAALKLAEGNPRTMLKKRGRPLKDGGKAKELAEKEFQEIARTDNGKPVFPVELASITVHKLGTVIPDRPAYHTQRYIYPAGFHTSREFHSMIDPTAFVRYDCEIIDNGTKQPVFKVTAADMKDKPVEAVSSSAAWKVVLSAVNAVRAKADGLSPLPAVSGGEFFGLTNPAIVKLILELPGAEDCNKFMPSKYGIETDTLPKSKRARLPVQADIRTHVSRRAAKRAAADISRVAKGLELGNDEDDDDDDGAIEDDDDEEAEVPSDLESEDKANVPPTTVVSVSVPKGEAEEEAPMDED